MSTVVQSRKPKTVSPKCNVFGATRCVTTSKPKLPRGLKLNARLKMDGLTFLRKLPADKIPVAFFDPQYRGVLDKMNYGNEGKSRGKQRCALAQMDSTTITKFIREIDRALTPSGHLFLWMDKFHLCTGFTEWLESTQLDVVDMVTWHKGRIGMGYRTRRASEHLIVLQKQPRRAKGVWKIHNIPDVWKEQTTRNEHTHQKPIELQGALLAAVSNVGDIVIDPAAGGFSVREACRRYERNFLGCDLNG